VSRPINQTSRRQFLSTSAAGIVSAGAVGAATQTQAASPPLDGGVRVISSGNGLGATKKAYELITQGTDTLDAVVAGVNLVEEDPNDTSVGYGGLPNENGVVQLDSAVMHGPTHLAGSVAAIENIKYPSRVALAVLKQTDHVLLVGKGALAFAKAHGFKEEDLLTDRARNIWLKWKASLSDKDDWLSPEENGFSEAPQVSEILKNRPTGTIHCAAINQQNDLSCVTTTSGLAFKIPSRVGDSPIIGAGLYVDNEIGSCGSTGRGEANLQNQCSFAAVELMRSGMTPQEAGLEVLRRVAKKTIKRLQRPNGEPDFGLNFYLIRKDGLYAGVAMRGNARFAITDEKGTRHEKCVTLY